MSFIINPFVFGSGGSPPAEPEPMLASHTVSSSGGSTANQIGIQFQCSSPITVTAGRMKLNPYQSGGEEVLRLWRVSDATLLASATITSATNTWVDGVFDTPVELAADASYIISCRRSAGSSRALATLSAYALAAGFSFEGTKFVNGTGLPTSDWSGAWWGVLDILWAPT